MRFATESGCESLPLTNLYGGKFSASGSGSACSFGFQTLHFGSYDPRTNVTEGVRFLRIGQEKLLTTLLPGR